MLILSPFLDTTADTALGEPTTRVSMANQKQ